MPSPPCCSPTSRTCFAILSRVRIPYPIGCHLDRTRDGLHGGSIEHLDWLPDTCCWIRYSRRHVLTRRLITFCLHGCVHGRAPCRRAALVGWIRRDTAEPVLQARGIGIGDQPTIGLWLRSVLLLGIASLALIEGWRRAALLTIVAGSIRLRGIFVDSFGLSSLRTRCLLVGVATLPVRALVDGLGLGRCRCHNDDNKSKVALHEPPILKAPTLAFEAANAWTKDVSRSFNIPLLKDTLSILQLSSTYPSNSR